MKKITGILLIILFLLFVAGCNPNLSQESLEEQKSTEPETSQRNTNSESILLENSEEVTAERTFGAKQDIITIHGYANFFTNVPFISDIFIDINWGYWEDHAFQGLDVRHIAWDSSKRIEEQLPSIISQFQKFLGEGHCSNGCIVFTHSTGGLVADVLLSRALDSAGTTEDFSNVWTSTTAVVEIASAGGGVQLADYAGDMVMGACNNFLIEASLETLFPFLECGKPESLGAGYDLRPSVARSINDSDNTQTLTLMIAGNGNMMGNIAKPFLKGTSDGLVAMHSACGGNKFESYQSCTSEIGPDGLIEPHTAPTGFYRSHYPLLMTEEGHTSELRPNFLNTDLISTKTETLVHGYGLGNFESKESTSGFWLWKKSYRTLKGSDDLHVSGVIGKYFSFY